MIQDVRHLHLRTGRKDGHSYPAHACDGEEGHRPVGAVLGQDGHFAAVNTAAGHQNRHLHNLFLERRISITLRPVYERGHVSFRPHSSGVFEQLEKSVIIFQNSIHCCVFLLRVTSVDFTNYLPIRTYYIVLMTPKLSY